MPIVITAKINVSARWVKSLLVRCVVNAVTLERCALSEERVREGDRTHACFSRRARGTATRGLGQWLVDSASWTRLAVTAVPAARLSRLRSPRRTAPKGHNEGVTSYGTVLH